MKNILKGKIATAIILLSTFVLAGVAIFTAVRLYQLRQTSVAPNVPSSNPKAADGTEGATCGFDETTGQTGECAPGFTCVQPEVGIGLGTCQSSSTSTNTCSLSFSFTSSTGSPSPTPTATATSTASTSPTPTATATSTVTTTPTPTSSGVPNSCGGTCGSNNNCGSDLYCYNGYCRNASCPSETDCTCSGTTGPTATATSTTTKTTTSTSTATATTEPTLPQSGTDWPTVLGIGIGILTIVGSLLLAL
jgi:hypothetical protein